MTAELDEDVRLIPLGGLGEFGLNAMVLEWREHRLLIDAGVMFASPELPGVDTIVPDFAYLAENPGILHGVLLTHGHEDHIGGLSFALQAAPAPVYGTRFTLGLVRRRLQERGTPAELRELKAGQPLEIGPFRVHPIHVSHSILDSLALAIETPAGVIVASGDFKVDPTAPPGERTDLEALSAWGDRGVLALLADSTNAERDGLTECEDDVLPAFEEVFERTPGRVVVSCFATSIPRIKRVADLGWRHGRSVAFVGRRMADNAEVAQDLGLLAIPASGQVSGHALTTLPASGILAFVSGSQGEPLSALSLVSVGEHPGLAVGPGDTVVLSARVIPGNERTVSRLIGNLFRRGCEVVHAGTAKVHVSGHGSRADLRELLARVRPRYLVPLHGEYRMLVQHARLAIQTGMAAERVLLAEDGDVLSLGPHGAGKSQRVAAGRVLLDRSAGEEVEAMVVRDRRHLSAQGVVVPVLVLDKQTGRLQTPPEIVTRGFVDDSKRSAGLLEDAGRFLAEALHARSREERFEPALTRERVRVELRRFFKKRTQRRPLVIPVVMEV